MNDVTQIQNEFGNRLLNFIRSRVMVLQDAEDIYQEVLVKIIRKPLKLEKPESLKSWLFTIAHNQIVDYYRSKKQVPIELLQHMNVATAVKDDAYIILEGCLGGFINMLPKDYQDVIRLSELEGKSQKEVAAQLDMNYVTLRSKVQRGRERIRKMILDACHIEKDRSGRLMDCIPNGTGGCGEDPVCDKEAPIKHIASS